MTTEILYTYLGTNGIVTTPVHLEGITAMKKYRIRPEQGKSLTNGTITTTESVVCSEEEVSTWKEV